MIMDIPTKGGFYTMANHIINEAWENIADLVYGKGNSIYEMIFISNLSIFWIRYAKQELLLVIC